MLLSTLLGEYSSSAPSSVPLLFAPHPLFFDCLNIAVFDGGFGTCGWLRLLSGVQLVGVARDLEEHFLQSRLCERPVHDPQIRALHFDGGIHRRQLHFVARNLKIEDAPEGYV